MKNFENVLRAKRALETTQREALEFLDAVIKKTNENARGLGAGDLELIWLKSTRILSGGTAGCTCRLEIADLLSGSVKHLRLKVLISRSPEGKWSIADADTTYGAEVNNSSEAAAWIFEGLEKLVVDAATASLSDDDLQILSQP